MRGAFNSPEEAEHHEQHPLAQLSTAFGTTQVQARWLCSSHLLTEAKTELEWVPGIQTVAITFVRGGTGNNNEGKLELEAKGHSSICHITIAATDEFPMEGGTTTNNHSNRKQQQQYYFLIFSISS